MKNTALKNGKTVFAREQAGYNDHIDHSLTVTGSGFQQEPYFSHLEEIILSLFNRESLTEQPKYIAHMGCGDGSLLKKIFLSIKNKSVRGKVLKEFPLKLIGIDSNEKVLAETSGILKDIDHLVFKEDIADPQQVLADLEKLGIQEPEQILHLCSFPDHHRVFSFTEHLKRWSTIIGGHGLIILAVHWLSQKTAAQLLDKSEHPQIDACQQISRQLTVEADRFLMAAAEAGLFPDHDFFRKYPESLPFCQVTLTLFRRRDYRVRCAKETDLPVLDHLEKQCWPPGLRRSVPVLKQRLQRYPEGQLVMENATDGQIVGAIYSQRITHPEEVKKVSMNTVEKLHRQDGPYAQLLAVNILPEMQNLNLGDQLLEFMLQLCSVMSGIRKVIGVTRCSDYHRYADTPPQEYIHLRNPQGRIKDTNLRFHQLHGAQIKEAIANYRPRDKQNNGYGVLVEYDIFQRQRNDIQLNSNNCGKPEKSGKTGDTDDSGDTGKTNKTGKVKKTETFDSVNDFIVDTIISVLGREDGFSLERPLMEMGLDSAHLLELNEQIRFRFQIPLESTFFFQYNTAARIISYLQEQVVQEKKEEGKKKKEVTNEHDTACGDVPAQKREIAIIGIACRLPGGIKNKEQLWELLINGKDAIGKMPVQRWRWPGNIDPGQEHRGIDQGGFLDDIAHFDASFFRITPKEAELMDPQQRILLELSWECLEDACYPAKVLSGSKTGVFIGASGSDYSRLLDRNLEDIDAHFCLGTSLAVLPNRISYFYDFNGPSLQIDTACSSSLAAVHEAVQSLLAGECRQALVGGIHIMCHPANSISYYKAGMLAKDGKCKTFDRDANGYVRGEGALMILLKPLGQAQNDGDSIYAVIKGTAINHGGQAGGLTAPNPEKQAALLINAFNTAGVKTSTIGYIEAHGTGTSLGDPIEINGLKQAFSQLAGEKSYTGQVFCGLGSIKTNIGHLEAAAGLAGLIKVVLGMQHQSLPASLNFNHLNPHINLHNTPFYIVTKNQPWKLPEGQTLRRAGVSSFGSGGTNAHVVLEEAPLIPTSPDRDRSFPCYLMCLSAKTRSVLQQKKQDLMRWLETERGQRDLLAVSAALLLGREHFNIRAAWVVKDHCEFREKLGETTVQEQTNGYFKEIKDKDNPAGKMKQEQFLFAELNQAIITELLPETPIKGPEYSDKLMALAELYINGYDANWKAFFPDTARTGLRIDLPFYPFAGERFWVPEPMPASKDNIPGNSGTTAVTAAASIEDDRTAQRITCFLEKQWEPCSTGTSRESNPVIAILATKETKALATRLSRLFPGSDILFHQDIKSQLKQPQQPGKTYDGCVNVTGCAKTKGGTEQNQSVSMDRVAWLKQLIENEKNEKGEKGDREGLMLLHVTRGLENFQNSDVNLSGALEAGLYRMLQSEYSHLRSRHMDADPSDDDKELARQIAFEFRLDGDDPEICYRGGNRFRACLREYPEGDNRHRIPAFPPDHVLWITGGTRGLGYLCARHFVSNYGVKRLLLTGQESFPPRDQWSSFQQQNTPIAQKIRGVQALEALGVQVQLLAVPLANELALKKSLQQVKKTMGPIGGIVHCAGSRNLDNPAFIRKSPAEIQQVLSPKKAGLDAMIRHVKHEPLQFFILFSSVAAIIPGFAPGNIDYAMANAYMDYAARANRHTFPLVSIQWPSWKETGMGEVKSRVYEQSGFLGLTDKEGLQLLDTILSKKMGPVVLPAVVDPARWKPRQLMQRALQDTPSSLKNRFSQSKARNPLTAHPSLPGNELREATEAALVSLFSRELKIKPEKLDLDTPFQDFGIDSILLAQILQKINQWVQVELDPSILMEYTTIASVSAWLASIHADSLSRALGMTVQGLPVLPVQDLQLPVNRQQSDHDLDIAVTGLSCRFPGAPSLEEYWQLLAGGRSAIKPVPGERWGYANHFYAGLLDNITHFDPDFFLIPEEDASVMDPQALLVLEESLKLWYQAGYTHQEIKGKPVGVFLGGRSQHWPDEAGLAQARNPIVAVGQNYLAANISHFFDLRGPVLVLDTACSSALVAMHTAIQALRSKEIDCALVGGVSLLNTDKTMRMFQQRNLLSREPAFHIFDQRANGVVLGEGVGLVLLKTKEQALKDGDRIYAIIKAIGINNDGRTAGPAVPNLNAQKQVLQNALARSGKKPEEISYIEANGSGSEVTDLLELKAIRSIYRSTAPDVPCGLGSMKPNIGHPLLAEGMAGFIKVVLMLQHRQWVPFLSGQQPMTHYQMESSPFHFCRKLTPWPDAPPVAAINCFADGGTNAHVILEAREETGSRPISRDSLPPPQLQRHDVRFPQVISAWKQKIMEE